MRKFLRPKFWSLGTNLGSPWAGLAKGLPQIFCHDCFYIVLRVPHNPQRVPFMVDFLFTNIHSGHRYNMRSLEKCNVQAGFSIVSPPLHLTFLSSQKLPHRDVVAALSLIPKFHNKVGQWTCHLFLYFYSFFIKYFGNTVVTNCTIHKEGGGAINPISASFVVLIYP